MTMTTMMMFEMFVVLVLCGTWLAGAQTSTPLLPPSITSGLNSSITYFTSPSFLQLPCCAPGYNSTSSYTWYVNGSPLNMAQYNALLGYDGCGGLNITTTSFPIGYYQCQVNGPNSAVAISNLTFVTPTVLNIQGPTYPDQTYAANVNQNVNFPCNMMGLLTIPTPIPSWQIVTSKQTQSSPYPLPVQPSQRIQIDDLGNLYIGFLTTNDAQQTYYYRCFLQNPQDNAVTIGVAYAHLIVNTPTPSTQPTVMTPAFKSYANPVIGQLGQSANLRCFFNGANDITITWSFNGTQLSAGRYSVTQFGSTLTVSGLLASDTGSYTCTGTSAAGAIPPATQTVALLVQATPYVPPSSGSGGSGGGSGGSGGSGSSGISCGSNCVSSNSNNGMLSNTNATVGGTATLSCNYTGIPPPTVMWYRNGQYLNPTSLPLGYSINHLANTLTISNLCQNCVGSALGNGVIQCNASNPTGYVLAQGYINVLQPTTITSQNPASTTTTSLSASLPQIVNFSCTAVSDPTTPITYTWLLNGVVVTDGNVNTSLPCQAIINIVSNNQGQGYTGIWTVIASNGVSSANATFTFSNGLATASAWQWWSWIPILIACLIILLFLLIFLCCYCCREAGHAYPVDHVERKHGNDPVKDLADHGFKEHQRPGYTDYARVPQWDDRMNGTAPAPITTMQVPITGTGLGYTAPGGPGSITSSNGRAASDDDLMSLNDYSNIQPGKFTEDGSFIGQYNPDSRRKKQVRSPPPHSPHSPPMYAPHDSVV